MNHCATHGSTSFVPGIVGSNSIRFNGDDAFAQLSPNLANFEELTVATWVFWEGGGSWSRIFDFGNDIEQNMFLTPNSGFGDLRFGIKNNGFEQTLTAPPLPMNQWVHVAVTLGTEGVGMYVNGQLVNFSVGITHRPIDFKPLRNYIGRSQYPDPLLRGRIDEFTVFNYSLSPDEISSVVGGVRFGDINHDGVVNLLDVAPFVTSVTQGQFLLQADVNQDGLVNLLDVNPFIGLLSGS